jgi:hypothetical protein
VRIEDDTEVTDEDIEGSHLILFGDPGSNRVLARVLAGLPLTWTESALHLAGEHPAADHAPALIAPNPLNPLRYVVVNSGHTFGAKEFAGSNAQLYPRLGDYAVFRLGRRAAQGLRLLRRGLEGQIAPLLRCPSADVSGPIITGPAPAPRSAAAGERRAGDVEGAAARPVDRPIRQRREEPLDRLDVQVDPRRLVVHRHDEPGPDRVEQGGMSG